MVTAGRASVAELGSGVAAAAAGWWCHWEALVPELRCLAGSVENKTPGERACLIERELRAGGRLAERGRGSRVKSDEWKRMVRIPKA